MLPSSTVSAFQRDGFVNAGPAISPSEADELAQEVLRVIADKDKPGVAQPVSVRNLGRADAPIWQIINIWEASAAFRRLLANPRITQAASQLLDGREIRLWHDQIQYKPVAVGGVNMWHQDSPYWPALQPKDQQVTCWIALDDADADNGCMSMVPGSQHWGNTIEFLHTVPSFEGLPLEFQGRPIQKRLCPVQKGHMHWHHSLTWHASHANRSGRPRRAIALHFMNERTVFVAAGDHMMKAFIQVPDGAKIEGEHFPLVWSARGP